MAKDKKKRSIIIDEAKTMSQKEMLEGLGTYNISKSVIRRLIKKGSKFYGNIFKGKYLDCGTLNGYIKSGIEISKENK